jgi:hypothetical protein
MAKMKVRGQRRWPSLALVLGVLVTGSWLLHPPPPVVAKDPDKPVTKAGNGGFVPDQVRRINEMIATQWKANNITPSKPCTDHEFIRRASLDIIGRIATPAEIKKFMDDPPPTRRAMLIDRLLQSDDFARNWASVWTVWLMTRSANPTYQEWMSLWLEEQFSNPDVGYDKVVTDLLTATGKNNENGAANFILQHMGEVIPGGKQSEEGYSDFVPLTSRTTRLFLGLQIQCTQCHNHPFNNQWKQKDFWGINAFFRQTHGDRPPVRGAMMTAVTLNLRNDPHVNTEGMIYYEQRNGVVLPVRPAFLDGQKRKDLANPGVDRRKKLAELVTHSEYFPKAYINRMWGHFFGRGMTVQGTVDDFGEHNAVTHPELLDYLAKEFKDYQFKPRELIRWICNSDAYSLSSVANKTNDKPDAEMFFGRMLLKAMTPEELFESLMVATRAEQDETKDNKQKLRKDWMKNLIVNFGDDEGNEVTFNGTVVQALLLMNGKEINDAISSREKGTVLVALSRKNKTKASIINDLFLAALNRPASQKETMAITKEIDLAKAGRVKTKDIGEIWQDLFWGLLNSNEFILNH